ncbi:histidine phosphatase family protein [Saccharopolyspora taberi]|uniref:Histidine phosphatase family protein n=1 Tax=Saccharopolyspora taberi TaxID=60895 RepID=A0ABN3VMP4_9PSEU
MTPDGTRLVLARHGQTPSNVRHALDTLPPGPGLTELGRAQARELAERLDEEKIRSIHASRAVRAQQTAGPLAARHGLEVAVVDGTHEIFVGDLEGTTDDESRRLFDEVYAAWHEGRLDVPMPGGETGQQAIDRFLATTHQVLDGNTGGTVVLVSHGAMLRLVAGHLAVNIDGATANSTLLPNAGIIVLDGTPEGWHCTQWDGLDLL